MKRFFFLISAISILLSISSCKDDVINDNGSNDSPVTFTVYGEVMDENGETVFNARVNLGTEETHTNSLGIYLFKDVEIDAGGAFLKVKREGYFVSGQRIQAKEASVKKVDVQLLKENAASAFDASAGAEINLNNEGLKIEFQPNSFVDENGQPYTGTVSPKYNFISADNENLTSMAPGGLSAMDAQGEEVVLASYGMLGVELNGGDVNIAEGHTARITMPVPNELLADAPGSIPLWNLNEETGFWEEEGTATLQGNFYVGDVAHFSFWNCDAPFPLVELSFRIVDENNMPLANEYISVTVGSTGALRGGVTDDDGYVFGKFPKDEIIQLAIEDAHSCSYYSLDESMGPFGEDADAGVFTAAPIAGSLVQIQGTIDNNCMNNNEEEHYLVVRNDNNDNCRWVFYIDDDNFDIQFQGNSADGYTAIVYDEANFANSIEYAIAGGQNDIGTVTACGGLAEYVILQVENGDGVSVAVEQNQNAGQLNLSGNQIFLDSLNLYDFDGTYLGAMAFEMSYTDENDKLNTTSLGFMYFGITAYNALCNNQNPNIPCGGVVLALDEFGEVGGYVSGTVSGELSDDSGTMHNYTLRFRFEIH